MSDPLLTAEEARVLGCLLEKEMTTPDYYPLTSNSLIAACNQSTNRDPVVSFDEATVEEALAGLRRKKLAAMLHLACSTPGIDSFSYPADILGPHYHETDLLVEPLHLGPDLAVVPDKPGLGVELDEKLLARFRSDK